MECKEILRSKERKIQDLKACGQSIIDNAEQIIESYPRATYISLSIDVHPNPIRVTINTKYKP